MSDLIRKNDALDILCKFCGITEDVEKCRKTSADGWCKEYCELKNMPTVDAVPVIRCKDCKHWRANTQFCSVFSGLCTAHRMPPNGYCSEAERKEE